MHSMKGRAPNRMTSTLLQTRSLTVIDYRCSAQVGDIPYLEHHHRHSLSFVRRGSFGCRTLGREFQLSTGSFFIGFPGDAYLCTHEHACKDECLSIQPSEELIDAFPTQEKNWRIGRLPPVADMVVMGALAQAAAQGHTTISLEEAAVLLLEKFISTTRQSAIQRRQPRPKERQRAIAVAQWLETHLDEKVKLADAARVAGLSLFHFLRIFSAVFGVTPHQYLLRARLQHAARRLASHHASVTDIALDVGFADLSNFVRTFHRAAGLSPLAFRKLSLCRSKILQERISQSIVL